MDTTLWGSRFGKKTKEATAEDSEALGFRIEGVGHGKKRNNLMSLGAWKKGFRGWKLLLRMHAAEGLVNRKENGDCLGFRAQGLGNEKQVETTT